MPHLLPQANEQPHAHDLKVILRTTLLLLKDLAPYIGEDNSLRNLELALRCAIADLEHLDLHRQERAVRGISEAVP